MNAARTLVVLAAAVVALGLGAGPAAADGPITGPATTGTATTGTADLIHVAPAALEIATPGPGHSASWTIEVSETEATAGTAVPLWLAVSGADGPLLHGTDPLHLTVTAEDGTVVLASADLASLFGRHVPLADLHGSTTLTATAALPATAGDEYRGADGDVQLTVTAQAPTTGSEVLAAPGTGGLHGVLARTGLEPTALLLGAATLLGAGATVLVARRRARSARDDRTTRTSAAPQDQPARTPEEDR